MKKKWTHRMEFNSYAKRHLKDATPEQMKIYRKLWNHAIRYASVSASSTVCEKLVEDEKKGLISKEQRLYLYDRLFDAIFDELG